MALSRFTPWFAVSALMPLGSSSAHSLHLDFFFSIFFFENINVTLRLFPFISIYPSFEVHAYIFPPPIMLVYSPRLHLSAASSQRCWGIKCNLCIIFKCGGYQRQRLRSETARLSLWIVPDIFFLPLPFVCVAFTHLNLNLVPGACVDTQRKTFRMHLWISAGIWKLR